MCFKGVASGMYLSRINTSKCNRCNFDVSEREDECPHCKGLSNTEAQALRENYKKEAVKTNSGLASMFIKSFIVLLCLMIVFYIV